ncbi:hypothetical protein ACIQZB_39160 [Streptomyces sp. NPDC097727]|uniref:hypothetical protein n=1 Tax=Streptomyces sp. NPDC097727 TaxID=3366092 RepID=UPI00381BDC79
MPELPEVEALPAARTIAIATSTIRHRRLRCRRSAAAPTARRNNPGPARSTGPTPGGVARAYRSSTAATPASSAVMSRHRTHSARCSSNRKASAAPSTHQRMGAGNTTRFQGAHAVRYGKKR